MRKLVLATLGLAFAGACEESPKATPPPAPSPGVSAPPPPPADGCAKSGSLEAVDADPACELAHAKDDVMRPFMKSLAIEVASDPSSTVGGLATVLRLTITNRGATEALVVFDSYARGTGPRPDWARISGVPEFKGATTDAARLVFPVTTVDLRDHSVDSIPMVPGALSPPKLLGVRLRPGGKLTHALPWWALRIPQPAPIFKDDAGHRIVPKTAPIPLPAGDYRVNVEVPLHGISSPERTSSTVVHVEAAPPAKTIKH
jgi:hypothetical protein